MTEKTFQKHKKVIDEYLINGGNGTKAYQKIYKCKAKTADANFRKILENTRIVDYLISQQKENEKLYAEKYELSKEVIVSTLSAAFHLDPLDFIQIDEVIRESMISKTEWTEKILSIKKLEDIPKELRVLIESIEQKPNGSIKITFMKKERVAAIINLMLGYNEPEKLDISGGYTYEIIPASEYVKRQKDSNTGQ